jgi:hypothetical protein
VPFWPGGLEDVGAISAVPAGLAVEKGLRTVAPGLSRGLRLPGEYAEDDVAAWEGLEAAEKGSLSVSGSHEPHLISSTMGSFTRRTVFWVKADRPTAPPRLGWMVVPRSTNFCPSL